MDEAIAAQFSLDQLAVTFNCLAEACFTVDRGQNGTIWPILSMGELCEFLQVGIVVRPASYTSQAVAFPR